MFNKPRRNVSLYAKLGLTQQASASDIQLAYTRLLEVYVKENEENKKGSSKKIKDLRRAYEVLINEQSRAMYDLHGCVGRKVKIRQAFSPESLDEKSSCLKGLWSCFFAATCCCCCYCFGHCCGYLRCNNHGSDDEDEIYVRQNFSEYVVGEPDACPGCFTSRRMKRERRLAARRHRRDFFKNKHKMRRRNPEPGDHSNIDATSSAKADANSTSLSGSVPRNKHRQLLKDSGYGLGINNMSFEEETVEDNNNLNNSARFTIGSTDSDGDAKISNEIGRVSPQTGLDESSKENVFRSCSHPDVHDIVDAGDESDADVRDGHAARETDTRIGLSGDGCTNQRALSATARPTAERGDNADDGSKEVSQGVRTSLSTRTGRDSSCDLTRTRKNKLVRDDSGCGWGVGGIDNKSFETDDGEKSDRHRHGRSNVRNDHRDLDDDDDDDDDNDDDDDDDDDGDDNDDGVDSDREGRGGGSERREEEEEEKGGEVVEDH